jgi:hypothetical protein
MELARFVCWLLTFSPNGTAGLFLLPQQIATLNFQMRATDSVHQP